MKIVAPVGNLKEVEKLLNAGADELYTGMLIMKGNKLNDVNYFTSARRGKSCSLNSINELKKANKIAKEKKAKIYITLNSFVYIEKQFPKLKKLVYDILGTEVNGFIVNCPSMVKFLKDIDKKIDIKISSMATCLNSECVKLYKKMGASQIVLPRHLSYEETKNIIKNNKDTKFEMMVSNGRCRNLNGLCHLCHATAPKNTIIKKITGKKIMMKLFSLREGNYGLAHKKLSSYFENKNIMHLLNADSGSCRANFQVDFKPKDKNTKVIRKNIDNFYMPNRFRECGLCSLYYFKKMGVNLLKIVGRSFKTNLKIDNVKMLKESLNLLNQKITKEEYFNQVKKIIKRTTGLRCSIFNCYYPEIFYNSNPRI
jgi:U32 family peptidase